MRLVLLLKADGQFKHSGQYALIQGRWHKVHADKPAPKGVPVSAHPKAAGHFEPVKHLTDDEWAQLKLPDSNTNAKTFNGQLDKLKQYSESGDVTAILGMQLGTNTYSKKIGIVANHLLGLHGSEHKVQPGQAAGSHSAVQTAPDTKSEQKKPAEPAADTTPSDQPAPSVSAETVPAPSDKGEASSSLSMPEFAEGKQAKGVKAHYEKTAKKILSAARKGDLSALQFMPTDKGNSWKGKTENSKKLMALHQAAIAHAEAQKGAGKDVQHPDAEKQAAQEAKELEKETGKPQEDGPKEGDTKPSADGGTLVLKDGHWVKQSDSPKEAAESKPGKTDPAAPATPVSEYNSMASKAGLSVKEHSKLGAVLANKNGSSKTYANLTQASNAVAKLKAAGLSAYVTGTIPCMVKVTGKTADGSETDAKQEGDKPSPRLVVPKSMPAEGKKDTEAKPTDAAQGGYTIEPISDDEPAQPSGATEKLAQIPWDKLKIPDTNSNAKQHNSTVDKIKEMADAGDVAGLQAMYDKKAGSKQTYIKKQALLAQTALAALEESAAAPAPAAETKQPEADGKPAKPAVPTFNDALLDSFVPQIKELMDDGSADSLQWLKVEADAAKDIATAPDSNKNDKAYYQFAKDALAYVQALHGAEPEAKAEKAEAPTPAPDGKPFKPTGLTSVHWSSTVDEIEKQMEAGNEPYLNTMVTQTAGLPSTEAVLVHEYAIGALGYLQDQKQSKNADTNTDNDGPKEGETKQGADGTLVFHNGRWHKQGEEKAAAEKPAPAGPAEVELPTFNGPNATHNKILTNAAAALKEKIAAEGKAGFKGVLTNHKTGHITVKIGGAKIAKASVNSKTPGLAEFAQFVDELKAAAGKAKATSPKPKTAAASVPAAAPEPAKELESMDHWTQTGGQGGSNPGGKFRDQDGVEWYCKFPADEHTAKAEVLAAKLYTALGMNAQDAKLITKDGKAGIASRWQDVKKATPKELKETPGVLAGFAADAWLANWDVVGLAYDNMQVDEKGNAMRVDAGGSLMYRAQGGKKAFGDTVTELDSMRDPKLNPQAAAVFGGMSQADITASVAKVVQISDAKIRMMTMAHGPGNKDERKALADTLIARKNDLLAKYPKAAKQTKKRLDPNNLPVKDDQLPKRHDFSNWNGPSQPLSSKAHVNEANQKAEDEMLALAKTGNLTKLKDYKFQPVDKDTGQPSGDPKPISEHPSKHVVQYHADLVQLLDEIANPPQPLKIFQESDVNTLEELEAAFPPKKFGTTANSVSSNEKLGFWVVLGGAHGAEKFKPKTVADLTKKAIDSAYTKFKEASKLAKHFVQSVQASGSYNDLFRDGKTHDHSGNKLSDVAQAALEFATEQPEGTSLYRWQNMSDDMVKKIMGAPEGSVFQATGPMCTSYHPTATSGFGKHRVTVRYAKGAKAVESFGSGSFAGEKEVTTLPNSRFVILKREMVPSEKGGGGQRLELEVLMLPPDLGL